MNYFLHKKEMSIFGQCNVSYVTTHNILLHTSLTFCHDIHETTTPKPAMNTDVLSDILLHHRYLMTD